MSTSIMDHIDSTTIVSLTVVVGLLNISYLLSLRLLHTSTPTPLRTLFIWHSFDFLIHTLFEGSFLYNCFLSSAPSSSHLPQYPQPTPAFLSSPNLVYGNAYTNNSAGKLWMVYSAADKRWGGIDLTVVSLELLTVFIGGPLAAYIAWGISRRNSMVGFWMVVLATAEIYGGFMTFAPEWLTGSENLDTSNFMFKWVYLIFFNGIWIVMPGYALWWAYKDLKNALGVRNRVLEARVKAGGAAAAKKGN